MDHPDLSRVVDEMLEEAWPRELRRAVVRMVVSGLWRVGVFLVVLLVPGLVLHEPWTFYGFVGGSAFVCCAPKPEEGKVLRWWLHSLRR